ncbi:MAG: hypothetical protein IT435_07215 [Phycisphaerales bacterium]|nr:hypothetical protein [Phycisphaerales bacterium]
MSAERKAWAARLRMLAEPVIRSSPLADRSASPEAIRVFIDTFADEAGHRRKVDRFLLSTQLGGLAVDEPAPASGESTADLHLWHMLAAGRAWLRPEWLRDTGPLGSNAITAPIEAWTERELAALHALAAIARCERDSTLIARCHDAARWFTREIQPDNATHHPWGIHTFIALWADHNDIETRLYAETMLHNCMVTLGRPDRLSACILWHAASELELGRTTSCGSNRSS